MNAVITASELKLQMDLYDAYMAACDENRRNPCVKTWNAVRDAWRAYRSTQPPRR